MHKCLEILDDKAHYVVLTVGFSLPPTVRHYGISIFFFQELCSNALYCAVKDMCCGLAVGGQRLGGPLLVLAVIHWHLHQVLVHVGEWLQTCRGERSK